MTTRLSWFSSAAGRADLRAAAAVANRLAAPVERAFDFQMVVLAALRARLKGWRPSGSYQLGAWGMPVTLAALAYGLSAIVVLVKYTATADGAWYQRYSLGVSALAVVAFGLAYMLISKPHEQSDAPHGDAIDAELNTREHARRVHQIDQI